MKSQQYIALMIWWQQEVDECMNNLWEIYQTSELEQKLHLIMQNLNTYQTKLQADYEGMQQTNYCLE